MLKQPSLRTPAVRWLAALALLLGLSGPTINASVTLSVFKATADWDGSILVEWTTSTEFNTQAFNLYRATSASGPWNQPVDQQEAQGDGFTGASYEYRDTDVEPGVRYYYLLEELISSGAGERFGPINAGIGLEPEPTFTATVTRTATATRTATLTKTSAGPAPATATRQYTNTPNPPATATLQPGGAWTPPATATASLLPPARVATPTPSGGIVGAPTPVGGMVVAPTVTPLVALPLAAPTPLPTIALPTPAAANQPTAEPTVASTAPDATPTPLVFAAATTGPALLDATTRVAPRPSPPTDAGRNSRLMLLMGGAAIALALLLAGAGLLIWRANRSR